MASIPCLRCRATAQAEDNAQTASCPSCGFVLPPPTASAWMVSRGGGQPFGPYTIGQLAGHVGSGTVVATDNVWHEGAPGWVTVGELPGLSSHAPAQPGHAPQPGQGAAPGQPYGGHPQGGGAYGGQPYPGQPGYADPYGPYAGGPYGGPLSFSSGGGFSLHMKRAFDWNLRHLQVEPMEDQALTARGIYDDNAKRYLVWRRSVLLMITIPLTIGAFLGVIEMFTTEWSQYSALGVMVVILRMFVLWVLPATAFLAAKPWDDQRKSRRILLIGWIISFAAPLLLALLPASWQYDTRGIFDPRQLAQANAMLSLGGAMFAYVTLMPAVLSLIPGVLRGCLRIKSLLPQAILPGLFLIAATPLYVLLFMVIFTTVNQIAGHFLLILAVLFLAASPVLYLFQAGTFMRPLRSEEEFSKIGSVQNQAIIVMGIGLGLLVLWAFVAEMFGRSLIGTNPATSVMRPWDPQLFQLPLEYIGRSLFTTVAVADLFMLMNLALWRNSKFIEGTPEGQNYDQIMGNIEEAGGAGIVSGNTIFRGAR